MATTNELEQEVQALIRALFEELSKVLGEHGFTGNVLNGGTIRGEIPLSALPAHAATHADGASDEVDIGNLAAAVPIEFVPASGGFYFGTGTFAAPTTGIRLYQRTAPPASVGPVLEFWRAGTKVWWLDNWGLRFKRMASENPTIDFDAADESVLGTEKVDDDGTNVTRTWSVEATAGRNSIIVIKALAPGGQTSGVNIIADAINFGPAVGSAEPNLYRADSDRAKTDVKLEAKALIAAGMTGATAASRYVGATASGAPVAGTFAVGDFVVAQDGVLWVCTSAGTPGLWEASNGAGTTGRVSLPDLQTYGRFIVNAHRGDINATDGYPELTVAAEVSAALKGCRSLDMDVQRSSDGTWHLMHDTTVDRTTDGSGDVSAKTDAQMAALNIDGGYGYRVAHAGLYHPPTLSAVITAVQPYDVVLVIQCIETTDEAATALATFLVAQGIKERVVISVTTQTQAQAVKAVDAQLRVMTSADSSWPEIDLFSAAAGSLTLAQVEALAPVQVHFYSPIADYGAEQAALVRAAFDAGGRGFGTDNLNQALPEERAINYADRVKASKLGSRYEPLTNGDATTPELVFAAGDVVMVEVTI